MIIQMVLAFRQGVPFFTVDLLFATIAVLLTGLTSVTIMLCDKYLVEKLLLELSLRTPQEH